MKLGARCAMPPRAFSNGVRRRRGGRRGGSSTSTSRHRQASVKSFFAKPVAPPQQERKEKLLRAEIKVIEHALIPAASKQCISPVPSTPSSPLIDDETLEGGCSPSDVPDMPSLEDREEITSDEIEEKGDVSTHPTVEVVGMALQPSASPRVGEVQILEHETVETSFNIPPKSEMTPSGAQEKLCVSPRWEFVSLSTSVNISPVRERAFIIPFATVSCPPGDQNAVSSPVTPTNSRVADAEKSTKVPYDTFSESSVEQPSRLSRRRYSARRAARGSGKQKEKHEYEDDTIVVDDGSVNDEDDIVEVVEHSRKRRFHRKGSESEKKQLHPFFKATAVSFKDTKDRPKRPRIAQQLTEAWTISGATLHVNCSEPSFPWSSPPELNLFAEAQTPGSSPDSLSHPLLPSYGPNRSRLKRSASLPKKQIRVEPAGSDMWVDKYKEDRRVDVISAAVTKELVDWLSPWYAGNTGNHSADEESSDEESTCSTIEEMELIDNERIAVLSGPVGCGKSTVVANAARQLGLTILEINASTIRTGRRLRDAIGEAMRTHRVASSSTQNSNTVELSRNPKRQLKEWTKRSLGRFKPGPKTLILLEEVDELQDDEKGFWACVQELAESEECRRPIVCTANSFSYQMKQVFVPPKDPIERDFQRLLIHSKEEVNVNPVSYKHISFPHRSEHQAAAVLRRVTASEKIGFTDCVIEYLAASHRRDTRRAINLLHLFGIPGLRTGKRPGRPKKSLDWSHSGQQCGSLNMTTASAFAMVADVHPLDVSIAEFHAGSESWATTKLVKSGQLQNEAHDRCGVLATWCESLEVLSEADMLRQMVGCEVQNRTSESIQVMAQPCGHEDIDACERIAEVLGEQASQFSRKSILLNEASRNPRELEKDLHSPCTSAIAATTSNWPGAKRPILVEYIPALRMMASVESSRTTETNYDGTGQDRVVRRTRSNARKGGFCALDLGPTTISELKSQAIRTQL